MRRYNNNELKAFAENWEKSVSNKEPDTPKRIEKCLQVFWKGAFS